MAFHTRDRRQRAWWRLTSTGPPYASHPQTSSTNSNSCSALYKSHGTKIGRSELQRLRNRQNRRSSPKKSHYSQPIQGHSSQAVDGFRHARRPERKKSSHNCSDEFEDLELFHPMYRLQEEGIKTMVIGLTMDPIKGKKGYSITPNAWIDEVNAE